jgi:hypothetical protein
MSNRESRKKRRLRMREYRAARRKREATAALAEARRQRRAARTSSAQQGDGERRRERQLREQAVAEEMHAAIEAEQRRQGHIAASYSRDLALDGDATVGRVTVGAAASVALKRALIK